MTKYQAIFLDVDGTLVDSNDAHARAFVEAMHQCGFSDVTYETVRPLIGMGGDQLLPRVLNVSDDSEIGKKIGEKRGDIFKAKYLPQIRPTPGAADLTGRLKAEGFRLVVVSSGKQDEVESLLKIAGVQDDIEQIVTGKDAPKSKPHPMAIQVALDKTGTVPENALLIGDTPWDVEAGHSAGVSVCALLCGGWWKNKDLPADFVFASPADLLVHYNAVFK